MNPWNLTEPAELRECPVERVRVPLEAAVIDVLRTEGYLASARRDRRGTVPTGVRRREAMTGGLALSGASESPLYGLARKAQRVLRVGAPFELYQTSSLRGAHDVDAWNARASFEGETALIEVLGPLVRVLDPGAALAVMGHEFGHFLAHGPAAPGNIAPWSIRRVAQRGHLGEVSWLLDVAARLSRARELTADRFGLLACQDIDAVLRLEIVAATGLSLADAGWTPASYLAHCRELMDAALTAGEEARPDPLSPTHPEHTFRAYAAWLFSESDLYRELTGSGPGTRTIESVNATLARLARAPSGPRDRDAADAEPATLGETIDAMGSALADAATAVRHADLLGALRRAGEDLGLIARPNTRPEAASESRAAETTDLDPETRELLARFEALERRKPPQ